jgi:hypothetical protein
MRWRHGMYASVTSVHTAVSPLARVLRRIRNKIKERKRGEGGTGVNWEGRLGRRRPAMRTEGAINKAK